VYLLTYLLINNISMPIHTKTFL